MSFHPFDVTTPHVIYACLGGFVVVFGMFSLFIRERLYVGEACWAFLFGVIIGPFGGNVFNPRSWGGGSIEVTNQITLEVTRVVLAIGVFAIGVELPKAYMLRNWKSIFFLIVPVMTYGWFVSAALVYAFIPRLNFLSSLAVAACLTPTDPILAAAVVGGRYADKHVPAHLRHLLAAESGCNDGAAFPFLFIALYLTVDHTVGDAIGDWFLKLWLYQITLATVYGSLLGFGFRHLMKFCERKDLIDRQSYVAQYVSLALLTIGTSTLLGTDDLLAAFCCGSAFAWDGFFNKQTKQSVFSSVIDLLFNVACFVYIGAWMPFNDFDQVQLTITVWRLVVIAILVLLLRRLPIMIVLYKLIPDVKTFPEAIFSGHFGPMGVGAIFISTLAVRYLPVPESPPANQAQLLAATIQPIVAFIVLCSILIHGLSIPFFSFGRHVHSVSRTWSRHGVSDWTTLTRRVSRAEDIVVNRDSDIERGELSTEKASSETPDESSLHSIPQTRPPSAQIDVEQQIKGEPPDGVDLVTEWKEGHDKIIERQAGPGEEVEVEVHRNAYGSSSTDNSTPHTTRGFLDKLQDTEHEVETAAAEFGKHVHEGLKKTGEKIRGVVSPMEDDADEDWASEGSVGSTQASPTGAKKTRSRSLKQKSLGNTPPNGPPTRKRHSTRAKRNGSTIVRGEGDSDHTRQGSRDLTPLRREFYDSDSRRGSLRNLRLESVRNTRAGSSREQSPARSVRFIDEDRVYSSRMVTSPLERPSSLPQFSDDEASQNARAALDVSSQA